MKSRWNHFLRCFFARRLLGKAVEDRITPSARAEAHLSICPGCHQWYAERNQLVDHLRREARNTVFRPSPEVRERIMNALGETPVARSGAQRSFRPLVATVATVALIALAVTWVLYPPGDSPPITEHSPAPSNVPVPSETQKLTEIEYARELERLIADGRATARFVLSSLPLDEE